MGPTNFLQIQAAQQVARVQLEIYSNSEFRALKVVSDGVVCGEVWRGKDAWKRLIVQYGVAHQFAAESALPMMCRGGQRKGSATTMRRDLPGIQAGDIADRLGLERVQTRHPLPPARESVSGRPVPIGWDRRQPTRLPRPAPPGAGDIHIGLTGFTGIKPARGCPILTDHWHHGEKWWARQGLNLRPLRCQRMEPPRRP